MVASTLTTRPATKGQQLQAAWGELLEAFPWQWYATLTFKRNVGLQASQEAWRAFCKRVRKYQGHRFEWFRVTELQQRGVPHFHVLACNCGDVRRLSAVDWWRDRYGFAQVQPYRQDRGARFYLAKCYVAKDSASGGGLDWQPSRGLRNLARLGAGTSFGPSSGVSADASRVLDKRQLDT